MEKAETKNRPEQNQPEQNQKEQREFRELEEEKNGDGTKAILEGDNGAFGGGFYLLHVFNLF